MEPARQYQVDRAVWLYRRLTILLDLLRDERAGEPRRAMGQKIIALSHRITRWLTGADATQRAAYYQAICAVDGTESTGARVSRRRGRQLKRMVEASREYDAQFEEGADGV